MSQGVVGMDIEASLALATELGTWEATSTEIHNLVQLGERLADISTGALAIVDEMGRDGTRMADALRRAASALEAFVMVLPSERAIARAVAAVHAFRGGDNDPELDRRVAHLRQTIDRYSPSTETTAQVMTHVLGMSQSVYVPYRDLREVAAARSEVIRLGELAAEAGIGANDHRVDAAIRRLHHALEPHAATTAQAHELVAAFLDDVNANIGPADLIASVHTGRSIEAVQLAHQRGIDYDVADALLILDRVDNLSETLRHAPAPELPALEQRRSDLLAEAVGDIDPRVFAMLTRLVASGQDARTALRSVDAHLVAQDHANRVRELARGLDTSWDDAESKLKDMTATNARLVEMGVDHVDASVLAQLAVLDGLAIDQVEAVAADEGIDLIDAAARLVQASALAMTLEEYDAYHGLLDHFDLFDNVMGGDADGLVSVEDLAFVIDRPEQFDVTAVAAATSLVAADALRNRLDTARERNTVVDGTPFGANRADDRKISRADLQAFAFKQAVNFSLIDRVGVIDVATTGDPSTADGYLSRNDFEAVQVHAQDLGFSDQEIAAVRAVLEGAWFDKTWWQENGHSVVLVSAAVLGGIVFAATGGVGAGLSGVLISTAAATASGAALGAGATVLENVITGDPLDEDVLENTVRGAAGGLAGAGLRPLPHNLINGSRVARLTSVLGGSADVAGLAANGLLDPVIDDISENRVRRIAVPASYFMAGASLGIGVTSAAGARLLAGMVDEIPLAPVSYGNYGSEYLGANSWQTAAVVAPTGTSAGRMHLPADAAATAPLEVVSLELVDATSGEAVQRVISVTLDELATQTGDD